jgi:hypothetical protein
MSVNDDIQRIKNERKQRLADILLNAIPPLELEDIESGILTGVFFEQWTRFLYDTMMKHKAKGRFSDEKLDEIFRGYEEKIRDALQSMREALRQIDRV